MQSDTIRTIRCAACSVLGLACALLWCTLMGHTPGFLLSSAGMGTWANARIFWLLGITLASAAFIVVPRAFKTHDAAIKYVLPLLAAAGSGCFALSFHQDFLPPVFLAVGGLVISGAGYFWLESRFVLLLARTRSFAFLTVCIAASFPVRQSLSLMLDAAMPAEWQVVVATALPILSALFFEGARRSTGVIEGAEAMAEARGDAKTVFGVRGHARTVEADRHSAADIIVLIVASAILLSIVRVFGMSGTWGDGRFVYFSGLGYGLGLLVTVGCLAAFAGAALVGMASRPLAIRFQPAILIVIAGLFVIASQAGSSETTALASALIEIDDPFAHLLFWCVIAVALDTLRIASYRVIGIAGAVYGACSIAWVGIVESGPVDNGVILGAIYLLIILAVGYLWIGTRRAGLARDGKAEGATRFIRASEQSARCDAPCAAPGPDALGAPRSASSAESGRAADAVQSPGMSSALGDFQGASAAPPAPAPLDIEQSIAARCEDIARAYRLTARETEVFTLLAQGRTRSFIVDALVLSDNTVKTHISHIYAKLDVHDRQGMMDLVLNR